MKKNGIIAFSIVLTMLLTGCSGQAAMSQNVSTVPSETAVIAQPTAAVQAQNPVASQDESDMFTDRDLSADYDKSDAVSITLTGSGAASDSEKVEISGSAVTILDEGVYILSGALDDGMIIVNAESRDKVQLVLSGVNISSSGSAAIYVQQADKLFITLEQGYENTLTNGGVFTAIDENNIDGVIFSKDDLTLNGTGSLAIQSPAGHGIVCKDDIVVAGGSYSIVSAGHGFDGKESVRIANGSFSIISGKDGIHAEDTDDSSLGFVYISDGSFDISSDGDGISSSGYMQLQSGSYSIVSGGGSSTVSKGTDGGLSWASAQDGSEEQSAKGIKAAGTLLINGGSFYLDSADDAIHSNSALTVNGGSFTVSSGDDGIHSNAALLIADGTINIEQSYEGIEGLTIDISGGNITLNSDDDGINAAGGSDQSGFGGFKGFGGNAEFGASSDSYINISGGILNINASGDGIDSNGSLLVSGGETYLSGPTDSGNGALDYGSAGTISGGVFIGAGAAGMAMNFDSSSTQGTMLVSIASQTEDTLTLTDSSGRIIVSWTPEKAFSSVVISCPEIRQGETYTLTVGSYSTEITMDSLVYGAGGMAGGMGGQRGDKAAMGEMPEMSGAENGGIPGGTGATPSGSASGHGGMPGGKGTPPQ